MLYTMLSGRIPFQSYQLTKHNGKDANYILDRIVAGKEFSLSSPAWLSLDISAECAQIIRGLLNVNAKMRMSVGELMNHPWIKHGPQRAKAGSIVAANGLVPNLSPMVTNGCKMQLRSGAGALMHDMSSEAIGSQLLLGTATEGLAKMVVDSKDSRGESMTTSSSKESVHTHDKISPSSSAVSSTSLSNASASSLANGMFTMMRMNDASSTENADTHRGEPMKGTNNNNNLSAEATVVPTPSLNPNKPKSRWTSKAARESRKRKQQQLEMRPQSNEDELSDGVEVYDDDDDTTRPKKNKLIATIAAEAVTNGVTYHKVQHSPQQSTMDTNAEAIALATATTIEPRLTTNSSLGGYDSGIQSLTSHYTASIGGEDRSTGSLASTGTAQYSYLLPYRGRGHSDMTTQVAGGGTSISSYSSSSSSHLSSSLPSIFAAGGSGSKSLVHPTPSLLNQCSPVFGSEQLFSELVPGTSGGGPLSPTTSQLPFWPNANGTVAAAAAATSSMVVMQMVSDANNNKSVVGAAAAAAHAQFLMQHQLTSIATSDTPFNGGSNNTGDSMIISDLTRNGDNNGGGSGGRKRYRRN